MATENTSGGLIGLAGQLGGFFRDIEVAKASKTGESSPDVRAETIADQTSVGRPQISGPAVRQGQFNVAGVPIDGRILATTGLVLGGLWVIRKLA